MILDDLRDSPALEVTVKNDNIHGRSQQLEDIKLNIAVVTNSPQLRMPSLRSEPSAQVVF